MSTADVIIVGAGVNGSSTAHHLAALGLTDVVVVDSHYPGAGASSRGMGLLRQYHANDAEARLAIESIHAFKNWADIVGGTCGYVATGFMWLDAEDKATEVKGNLARITRLGARAELLDEDGIRSLQPHMAADGTIASYEPDGGTALGALATDAWLASARRRGARLRTHEPVRDILVEKGRVAGVRTTAGEIAAGSVVVAAGAWTAALLETAGVSLPIQPRRLTIGRAHLPVEVHSPVTFLDGQHDTSFRVDGNHTALLSMRDERYGAPVDPAAPLDAVDPWAIADGMQRIRRRIPSMMHAAPANTWTGVDGFTPDYKGVYGEIEGVSGLYVIAGASEKGFKVSPAVGRGMAELITTGQSDTVGDPAFSPARFGASAACGSGWISVGALL